MVHGQKQSGVVSENAFVATKLTEVADLLEQQNASRFRVRAYRDAGDYIQVMPEAVRDVYERSGRQGLEDLPTVGPSIARAIIELLATGDLGLVMRLRGSSDPEQLFQAVPMIGPALAHAIHDTLHIDTLEALEAAAHDGRLAMVKGVGRRRVEAIRYALNDLLARRRPRIQLENDAAPSVSDILSVDEEYRTSAPELPHIKPRRFNETGRVRLPILHTERGPWRFTAIFSNTAAAHQYRRTRDWVVVYFEKDGAPEGLATVVTQSGGPLDGQRVIRGREADCVTYYSSVAELGDV